MDYQLGHEKRPKHPKEFEKADGQSLQRIGQSSKLGDRFKLDKLEQHSVDLRADLVKDVNSVIRKTEGFEHQQQAHRKADEVVRYMSNLPSYLERGEKHQEKAFNVGVLEWGRLEKWQHNQRQLFRESSTYSPSTSNTSSNSSTRESSSHSSRGRTCTPGRLRTYHATAECNRRGSLSKVSPNGAKCSVKDVFTADDLVAIRNDYVKVQQSILKTHQCFNKYTELNPEESKPKHPHRQSISDRRPQEPENRRVTPDSKGKLKVQGGDLLEEKEKSKGSNGSPNDQHRRNTQQTVVLLRPKDKQETRHPAAAELSNSTKKHSMGSLEANQRILFDHPESKGHKRSSNRARSCSLSRDTDWIGHPPIEQPGSTRMKEIRFPLEIKRAIVHPRGSSVSPVRSRIIEDISNKELSHPAESSTLKVGRERALVHSRSKSVGPAIYKTPEKLTKELGDSAEESKFMVGRKGALVHPRLSSVSPVKCKTPEAKLNNPVAEPADVQKLRVGCEVDKKERNPSPFRRFSFSMGRIVKSSSSDDLSSMAQNNHHVGKLGSMGSENSIPQSNTPCEKSISNRKATGSPLRRFLDPFLKQRAGNSDHSPDFAPGPSVFRDGNGNVSNRLGEAHALNSIKVKLDLGSCKEIDIDHPHDMNKRGSPTVQALLQVALKNGLPLFTFAVDNSSDILAATMTRLSSGRKDGNKWIFTFFTVHEMKKKSGSWLNYASKERKQGYIPNVVGQMKVSDVPNPDFVGKQSADSFRIREFVLLGVNLRQADEKSSDLQANDELAAIVLKLPSLKDNQRNHIVQKSSTTVVSQDSSQKLGNVGGGKSSAGSENLLGLTAILPGGEHGLPCNGRPSPLIERWRFEGSCDCGGWDLGCRLRVLTSQTHTTKQSSSDTALSSKKIHLYSQDHELETKPVVSLSPFKDGFYSVEFDSSLKLLQAFSICIAILNGLKPLEFFDMSSFFQKKSPEEPNTRSSTEGAKHPHIIDGEEIPACFGSCPPDTPADRV